MGNQRKNLLTKNCTICGIAISSRCQLGLCRDHYLETRAGRNGRYRRRGRVREYGKCMICKRKRLVPDGKDKRYFRCDTCNLRLEQEGFLAGDAFARRASLKIPTRGMWR